MRNFTYRPPRLSSDFSVDFLLSGRALHGRCINISDAGIRATLDGEVPAGCTGSLILHHPRRTLTLQAIATHLQTGEVGLSFLFASEEQRELIRQFIALVAATPSSQS